MKKVLRIALAIVFVLIVVADNGFSLRSPVLSGATRSKVILSGTRILQSSPATADLNGDGDKEIVVGGWDGMLYVIEYDGSTWKLALGWQTADDLVAAGAPGIAPCVSDQGDIRSAPAVADLDNDGRLEIVVSTGGDMSYHRNGGVLVYRYESDSPWDFSVVPGWPQPKLDKVGGGGGASYPDGCWDAFWSTPALGDLDGDGDLEVVIEGFDRHLYAWHHDGTMVGGWPIYRYEDETDTVEGTDCLLRGGWSSPALGDVDGDGLPEVVVGTDSPPWDCPGNWNEIDYRYATVWAINGDSTNVPGWPVTTQNNVQSSPALGDIDADGQLEVVVGSGLTVEGGNGHWVHAWEGDGTPVTGWPKATDEDMQAPPALGDLDHDGDLEIVIGGGKKESVSSAKLYAWHGDGSPLPGFPMALPPNDSNASPRDMPYSPLLADINGDGEIEILVTHINSVGIATVRYSGANWISDNDPTLRSDYALSCSPVVDDLDGDGYLEIAIGGSHNSSTGAVYIWEVDVPASSALPWPMFHRDVQRTGRLAPPRMEFVDEIYVFHEEGSGDTATTYESVGNLGDEAFDWEITHAIPGILQVIPPSGVVTDTVQVQLVITTTGVTTGTWQSWPITVTGTFGGNPVVGSPHTATLYLFVGDIERAYLPLVLRNHTP